MNTTEKIIELYQKGASMASLSRKYKLSQYRIKKILKENGIQIRSRVEQLVLENIKRAKKINHYYFDELTQENVYYLGFIAADGTVRKNNNEIKIALSKIDYDFLKQFKEKIQTDCKIGEYTTSNGFECVSLAFSSVNIKNQLAKYSIVPNKTYLGITMENIPNEFKLAFIKGFFDGDGCFTYNKNTKQCMIKIASHKRDILDEINDFFENKGHVYLASNYNNYNLEFSTLPSLEIMRQFYNLNTPCLERKKEKYLSYLELRK